MKIKNLFLALAASAFVLAGCEKPAPPRPTPTPEPEPETVHAGTLEDPFTVADAIVKCKAAGTTATTEVYYVEGIASVVDASGAVQYNNVTIDLKDEGANDVFKAYRVKPVAENGNLSGNEVKVGDRVLVKGCLVNYSGNTPETASGTGYLVKVNGADITFAPCLVIKDLKVEWNVTTATLPITILNPVEGVTPAVQAITEGLTVVLNGTNVEATIATENETENNKEYQFKATYTGAADVTVTITQKKQDSGEAKPLTSSIVWTLGANSYSENATVNETPEVDVLKLCTSKAAGSATLTIPEGTTKIGFYAIGWKGAESTTLTVGDKTVDVAGNDGATGNKPYTLTITDDDYYEVEVSAGEVTVSAEKRVLILGINPVK